MNKVLLALSTTRKSPASMTAAIDAAKKGAAELLILFVIDQQYSDRVIKQLTEEGWIGGSPSEKLYEAMQQEYAAQAEAMVQEIQQMAEREGVRARSLIREGEFRETVLSVIADEQVDMVILTRRRRSAVSRLLFGSAVADIKKQSPCPTQIIDE